MADVFNVLQRMSEAIEKLAQGSQSQTTPNAQQNNQGNNQTPEVQVMLQNNVMTQRGG